MFRMFLTFHSIKFDESFKILESKELSSVIWDDKVCAKSKSQSKFLNSGSRWTQQKRTFFDQLSSAWFEFSWKSLGKVSRKICFGIEESFSCSGSWGSSRLQLLLLLVTHRGSSFGYYLRLIKAPASALTSGSSRLQLRLLLEAYQGSYFCSNSSWAATSLKLLNLINKTVLKLEMKTKTSKLAPFSILGVRGAALTKDLFKKESSNNYSYFCAVQFRFSAVENSRMTKKKAKKETKKNFSDMSENW